jgi:hypothetical protein
MEQRYQMMLHAPQTHPSSFFAGGLFVASRWSIGWQGGTVTEQRDFVFQA